MKKNTIKAFTLVEMLIVIVIIGILIAALMPRMQSAQWRARDVARKNDLAQIATAMVTSQQDKWEWPGLSSEEFDPTEWISVSSVSDLLLAAGLSSVPWDPLSSQTVSWLWEATSDAWQYLYMVTTRNGSTNWWFILMAKTEIEWGSNYVVCDDGIAAGTDLKTIHPCTKISKGEACSAGTTEEWATESECTYTEEWQLRYIYMY